MCDPREKSQRIEGSERDAGCDCSSGVSKRDREAMPPEAIKAVEMLRSCAAVVAVDVEDMVRLKLL